MSNEAAISMPAGWGYRPGRLVDVSESVRKEPDRRYQRAFAYLIAHPKWVAGRIPQTMVAQALREKFRLRPADADAVYIDVREAIEVGVRTEDFSPQSARLPPQKGVSDESIIAVMQESDRFRAMRRVDAAEELSKRFSVSLSTSYAALNVVLGRRDAR